MYICLNALWFNIRRHGNDGHMLAHLNNHTYTWSLRSLMDREYSKL